MRSRNKLTCLALILLCGSAAWAATESQRASLRGLTGVQVRVESLSERATRDGLDEKAIQGDVEQRLRAAGIKPLTSGQASQDQGAPILYVRVNAKWSWDAPLYAVNTTVALRQDVALARDSSLRVREVKTWDAGYTRTYDKANVGQARGVVGDLVNEFIRDWRAANSK